MRPTAEHPIGACAVKLLQHMAGQRLSNLRFILVGLACLLVVSCAPLQYDRLLDFTPATATTQADFQRVAEYASYAQAAYWPEEQIRSAFPDTVRINAPGENGTSYFLTASSQTQTQTISVRGTHTFADILHDIEFQLTPDSSLEAAFHKGFEEEALLIYDDVRPHLNRGYSTRLTGHSLGAAVSAILMIYLQRDGYIVEPSINFGQPKFMNAAGVERYADLPLQRVVNHNDIIPMLPPTFSLHPRFGAYAHVGEELVLLDGPYYVHLEGHDAERVSIDEFWRERNFASQEDHHMQRYQERIRGKLTEAVPVDYGRWRQTASQ